MGTSTLSDNHNCKEDNKHSSESYFVEQAVDWPISMLEDNTDMGFASHQFKLRTDFVCWRKQWCDVCTESGYSILHNWYACTDCGFRAHAVCLRVRPPVRRCAFRVSLEQPCYTLQLCRQRGLASQRFKCAECAVFVLPEEADWRSRGALYTEAAVVRSPILCDYSGSFYCNHCCWGDTATIPARVVHNWDFNTYTVSRATLQYLDVMYERAVMDVTSVNPKLFTMVQELGLVRKLRRELDHMLTQLELCSDAIAAQSALVLLRNRRHLATSPDIYSMRDLADTNSGQLVPLLQRIRLNMRKHLLNCPECSLIGNVCSVCESPRGQLLLPFEEGVSSCAVCSRLVHAQCRPRGSTGPCPACQPPEQGEAQ